MQFWCLGPRRFVTPLLGAPFKNHLTHLFTYLLTYLISLTFITISPDTVHSFFLNTSGGASVENEPGHFEVRKSSSQVTRMHFYPKKS